MPARVVAIWNELTPYRLHVMRRVRREAPDIEVVNAFTHSVTTNSSPWKMDVDDGLGIWFDEANRIRRPEQFLHRGRRALAGKLEALVSDRRPDFVLMHGHNDAVRLGLIRRFRRMGIPMAHASDANVFCEMPGTGVRRIALMGYRAVRSWILGHFDAYMPMGTAGRAFYDVFGRPGVPCFPFPYEPDYDHLNGPTADEVESFRARHGIEASRRYLLCSSRLVPVKRVDIVLQAFARIAGARPQWDLLVAGDGPLRQELESTAGQSIPGRVKFLGFVQMDDLRCAYRLADGLVHASEREPWALVINEAANAGLPIIATDVTGAAIELVRDRVNGRLVRPGCTDDLADAMAWLTGQADLGPLRAGSGRLLREWRAQADPVEGFRATTEYFSRRRRQGRADDRG